MKSSPVPSDRQVFINCPFDPHYLPIFQAIVFAVHDAGFIARSALETLGAAEVRLQKILRIIKECGYGIHDLSRVETGRGKLPRFNMAFEAGLFLACKVFGGRSQRRKQMLLLDSEPYRWQRTLSDMAGQDAQPHSNDPEQAIALVRTWLRATSGLSGIPGGKAIIRRYRQFQRDLPAILRAAKISPKEIRQLEFFSDYREFVVAWLQQHSR